MKKIIRLSDLHVGYKHCENNLKKLVTDILDKYSPDTHVVVVTGDIVENANKDGSYDKARNQLKRLEDKKYRVLVVPGNHDYGSGSKGKKKYVKLFKKAFFDDGSVKYTKVNSDGDIIFVGLDSMAETFDWLDIWGADGELGNKQLKDLARLLDSDKFQGKKKVVYLHHHPFDARGRFICLKIIGN